MFCEGQAYVALSRVKTADSVHILKFDISAFKTNMEIVDLLNYANRNKSMKNYTFFFFIYKHVLVRGDQKNDINWALWYIKYDHH